MSRAVALFISNLTRLKRRTRWSEIRFSQPSPLITRYRTCQYRLTLYRETNASHSGATNFNKRVAILSDTCAPSFSDNPFYCRHNIIPLFSIATASLATVFASRIHIAIPDEKLEIEKLEKKITFETSRVRGVCRLQRSQKRSFILSEFD